MKNKRQRVKLAGSEEAPPPPGMSAFAAVLATKKPEVETPRYQQEAACPILWTGCKGETCNEHPNALTLAKGECDEDLRYGTLMTLLSRSERSLEIFEAMLGNGRLSDWAFHDLVKRIPNSSTGMFGGGGVDQVEARYLAVLASERCKKRDLLTLARMTNVTEEALYSLLTHPKANEVVEAEVVLTVAHLHTARGNPLRQVVRDFGGENARACLALAMIHKPETATELLKTSRRALARFNHCRADAIQMMETLTPDWAGTLEEFIDMTAMILGKKQR